MIKICGYCGKEGEMSNRQKYCGNQFDTSSCSYLAALKKRREKLRNLKKETKICGWCRKPLVSEHPGKKYHGSQSERNSCAHKVQLHNITRYNQVRALLPKAPPKPKRENIYMGHLNQ